MDAHSADPSKLSDFQLCDCYRNCVSNLLLVIPGIVFWVHSAFAPFLLVEENLGPFEAAKRSRELVRGYFWQVFFCQLLFLLTDIVGNNIPSVGTTCPIAFSSFYDLFMARVYIYRKSLLTND